MSTAERAKLEKLSNVQLRNLVAKGPKGGMRGGGQAGKTKLVDYLINHPTLRPARWAPAAPVSSAPAAKRARLSHSAMPAPNVQAANPAAGHAGAIPPSNAQAPNLAAGPPVGVLNQIRGMLYPHHQLPVHYPALETPAQTAERQAREWALIEAALDIEEEADAYDSEDDESEGDSLWGRSKGSAVKAAKREEARQYREELELRGNIRVQEHWRRADVMATFERELLARGGLSAAMLAELRGQDALREAFWKEEDRRRDEFWREEDRRRNDVWEDRRRQSMGVEDGIG